MEEENSKVLEALRLAQRLREGLDDLREERDAWRRCATAMSTAAEATGKSLDLAQQRIAELMVMVAGPVLGVAPARDLYQPGSVLPTSRPDLEVDEYPTPGGYAHKTKHEGG